MACVYVYLLENIDRLWWLAWGSVHHIEWFPIYFSKSQRQNIKSFRMTELVEVMTCINSKVYFCNVGKYVLRGFKYGSYSYQIWEQHKKKVLFGQLMTWWRLQKSLRLKNWILMARASSKPFINLSSWK